MPESLFRSDAIDIRDVAIRPEQKKSGLSAEILDSYRQSIEATRHARQWVGYCDQLERARIVAPDIYALFPKDEQAYDGIKQVLSIKYDRLNDTSIREMADISWRLRPLPPVG